MLGRVWGAYVEGVEARPVRVEVDVGSGLPGWHIVGLPEKAVQEAKERVWTAIRNTGIQLEARKMVVNLSPATHKKSGSHFDLSIALGLLKAHEILKTDLLDQYLWIGELTLEGGLCPVPGLYSYLQLAKKMRLKGIVVSSQSLSTIFLTPEFRCFAFSTLSEVLDFARTGEYRAPAFKPLQNHHHSNGVDFAEVRGQTVAKRALEVAASGGHHVLFIGPPGSGKTMLAERFSTICPPLTAQEMLEVYNIHTLAGERDHTSERPTGPFRNPHHSTSNVGLIGGGNGHIQLGEITLAHRGVLFLDELPEFSRSAIEALRQPMEAGVVRIVRAEQKVKLPAQFLLLAAMNPCKCGYLGHPKRPCVCPPGNIFSYRRKISGPLIDRIDLHVEVRPLEEMEMFEEKTAESSASIRERVLQARRIQQKRYQSGKCNAELKPREILQYCALRREPQLFLRKAIANLHLSMRAYHRILKVARTIADLAGSESIATEHIAEAVQYRSLDRENL